MRAGGREGGRGVGTFGGETRGRDVGNTDEPCSEGVWVHGRRQSREG